MFGQAELQDIKNGKWIFDDTLLKLCEYYDINSIYMESHSSVRNVCQSDQDLDAALLYIQSGDDGSFFVPLLVHSVKKDFSKNNHYVGIFIKKDHDQYYVTYIDPMGRLINSAVRESLYRIFGREIRLELYKGNIQFTTLVGDGDAAYYEGNTNDCGPMLVYLVALIAHDKPLPLLKSTHNLAVSSKQVGKNLRTTILKDIKETKQSLLTKKFDSLSIATDHVDDTITDTVAFPRCEYYTRFQGTTAYAMDDSGYWGTYFRSVKSRHDKPTKFTEDQRTLHKPGITPAKAGGFQSLFNFPKYKKLVNYPIAALSAVQPSSLYDAILQYKQRICKTIIEKTSELVLQNQITVVYANSYPCLMVHVPIPVFYEFSRETDVDNWAKISMSCYVAVVNRVAYELGVPIEIVMRSSFGHNIPSVSGTGTTFRINIGIVPEKYTAVLVEGIKRLDTMVTSLKDTQVTFRAKQMKLLECFNKIATLKNGKKQNRTETVLAELVRQRYYLDFFADEMVKAVLNPVAMQNIWQRLIDRITIRQDKSITFQLEDTEFKLQETQKGAFNPTECDLRGDAEFWKILSLINTAFRNQDLQAVISRKSVKGLYKVLEKANLGVIKRAPQYEIEDDAGSDSGVEDEGTQRLYARKVVVTTGMKAINLAAFLVHAYCTARSVFCNFDTKYMYYETGDALKFCNNFLSHAFSVPVTNVKISCIDLNYCSAVGDVSLPLGIFSSLPVGNPVILDYTSATAQLINDAAREALRRAPVVILLNSGLKNEQLGADINTYGTVRIVTSERYTLDMLYSLARESLRRTPGSMLPPIAHQIRKTYKDLGCAVTNHAVFGRHLRVLSTSQHLALQGYGYWDAIDSMSDLYERGLAPEVIMDRLYNLQQLLAHRLPRNIFWIMFSNIDFLDNFLLRKFSNETPDLFVRFIEESSWSKLEELERALTLEYLWNSWLEFNSASDDWCDELDKILDLCGGYIVDENNKGQVIMLLRDERGYKRIEEDGLDSVLRDLKRLEINSDDDPLDVLDYQDAMEGCPDEMFPKGSSDDEENYGNQDYHNDATGSTEEADSADYSDESDDEEIDSSGDSSTGSLDDFSDYHAYLILTGQYNLVRNLGYEKIQRAFYVITNEGIDDYSDITYLIKELYKEDLPIAGAAHFVGLPMKLQDLNLNAELCEIPVIHILPSEAKSKRYLLIDSADITVVNRDDVDVIHQDIQGNTASCGDNALFTARKAQELGFETYIYVNEGHATAVVKHNAGDHSTLLRALTTRQLEEDHGSWGRYTAAMGCPQVHHHSNEELVLHNALIYNVYHDVSEYKLLFLLRKYGIEMSIEEAMTDRGFRQASLKLHPDRPTGNKEDFQSYKDFRDRYNNHAEHVVQDVEITVQIQRFCYQASFVFKALDTGVDVVRAYYKPTTHHIVDVAIGASHLFSMTTGVTKFSTAASVISVGYTFYEGGIYEGTKSAAISLVFIAVPSVLVLTGVPYIATAYTVALTVYTGYNLINNAMSLYNELSMQNLIIENTESHVTSDQSQYVDEIQHCSTNSTCISLGSVYHMDLDRIDVAT